MGLEYLGCGVGVPGMREERKIFLTLEQHKEGKKIESNINEVYQYKVSNYGNIRNRQTMRILKSRATNKYYLIIDILLKK